MPAVYRSVRVVVQNSSNELMTLEGFDVLAGNWTQGFVPVANQTIDMQGTAHWESESQVIPRGTQAYVRLGCTKGYVSVEWERPWVGDFEFTLKAPRSLALHPLVNLEEPASPVLMVTIRLAPGTADESKQAASSPLPEGAVGEVLVVEEAVPRLETPPAPADSPSAHLEEETTGKQKRSGETQLRSRHAGTVTQAGEETKEKKP